MSFPWSTRQNLEGILVAHWKGNTVLKWGRNNIIYSYPILIQVARREGRGIFWWKGTKEVISTTCKVLVETS